MDGWIDSLRFYVLFNNIEIILGQWETDNEKLVAMKPCLRLKRKRFPPPAETEAYFFPGRENLSE